MTKVTNNLTTADKVYIEQYMKSNSVGAEWKPYLQHFLSGYKLYVKEVEKQFKVEGHQ